MLHVHGEPLSSTEVERLIRALNDDGGPAALEAATTIAHAYVEDHFSAPLSFDTREAIAFVLAGEDDLTEGLQHLRETLSRHAGAPLKIMWAGPLRSPRPGLRPPREPQSRMIDRAGP